MGDQLAFWIADLPRPLRPGERFELGMRTRLNADWNVSRWSVTAYAETVTANP